MPLSLDTPPELAERLSVPGDGKVDDLALLPGNFRAFAAEMRAANELTKDAREGITAKLDDVTAGLKDVAKQQIEVVATINVLSGRVSNLEGVTKTLDTNLRETATDLKSRVAQLEDHFRRDTGRIFALENIRLQPSAPPAVPGRLFVIGVAFALALGAGGFVVLLQWLAHLSR